MVMCVWVADIYSRDEDLWSLSGLEAIRAKLLSQAYLHRLLWAVRLPPIPTHYSGSLFGGVGILILQ